MNLELKSENKKILRTLLRTFMKELKISQESENFPYRETT